MGNYYYDSNSNGEMSDLSILTPRQPLHIRVFYVRISKYIVDNTSPESLTLNLIPLSQDTILKVNGVSCSIESDGISCVLRRDRVDKKSEEVTFVSTDSVTSTDSVKFEVLDEDDLLASGVLDMSNSSGSKNWSLKFDSVVSCGNVFSDGKPLKRSVYSLPVLEVYVAGCFSGSPIIFTKTLQLDRKKHGNGGVLVTIPENDSYKSLEDVAQGNDLQVSNYRNYKSESEEDLYNLYWRRVENMEGEDGELSWFNAGVGVGVGLGLSVCLSVGVGVGLLLRTYKTAARTFRRRIF